MALKLFRVKNHEGKTLAVLLARNRELAGAYCMGARNNMHEIEEVDMNWCEQNGDIFRILELTPQSVRHPESSRIFEVLTEARN